MDDFKEKADKLKVPVIPPITWPQEKHPKVVYVDVSKEKLLKYLEETVAVCGGCGKEIKRHSQAEPCGRNNCPFGILMLR